MFKNFIKVAYRNIMRYKGYSFIHVTGLAIGMACSILIMLWIFDELSYDQFHQNKNAIYRLLLETKSGNNQTISSKNPNALGPMLMDKYPEVTEMTRYMGGYTGWLITHEDQSFTNDRWATADPSFFKIFSFPFLQGDPETALNEKASVVITDKMAQKYFGNDNAIGKILKKDNDPLKVTGVIQIPENSHLQFDYLFPIENMRQWFYQNLESWEVGSFHTYIQLQPGVSSETFQNKITKVIPENNPHMNAVLTLQSLQKIHLFTRFQDDGNANQGNILYVTIFSVIALCILLVACINFMNLASSRASTRMKEIGVRKVVGARRKQLAGQFLGEAIIYTLLAMIVAILLIELSLPHFNALTGKHLSVFGSESFKIPLMFFIVALGTGILAGSYPAFVLSSLIPIHSLNAKGLRDGSTQSLFRKTLVIIQFTTAIVLIIGTLILNQQLRFMQKASLGYDKENILYFYGHGKFMTDYRSTRQSLLQHPNIVNLSKAFPPFFPGEESGNVSWDGKDPNTEFIMHHKTVDSNYLKTFNMQMVAGRFFNSRLLTDESGYVLNETAVKEMALESPVGKQIAYQGRTGTIIGVMKDFHHTSFHSGIKPLVFELYQGPCFICIKIKPDHIQETLAFLGEKWDEYVPGRPFSYTFFDDYVNRYYQNEQFLTILSGSFASLAVFISCLGLLGLVSFMVEKRTCEIGIRKVLGSSFSEIIFLLSKTFVRWILVANLIAWPLTWLAMNKWLQNFAYRIHLTIWPFLLAGVSALIIALLTVSWVAVRAAMANPVESLRYE